MTDPGTWYFFPDQNIVSHIPVLLQIKVVPLTWSLCPVGRGSAACSNSNGKKSVVKVTRHPKYSQLQILSGCVFAFAMPIKMGSFCCEMTVATMTASVKKVGSELRLILFAQSEESLAWSQWQA